MRGVILLLSAAAAVHPHLPKDVASLVEVDASGQAGRVGLQEAVVPPPPIAPQPAVAVAQPAVAVAQPAVTVAQPAVTVAQPAVTASQVPGLPGAAPAGGASGPLPDPTDSTPGAPLVEEDPVVAQLFGPGSVQICTFANDKVHLIKGSMQDFHFMDSTAAVLNIGGFSKGTGTLGGMAKEFFSAWSMQLPGLSADWQGQADIQIYAKDLKQNPVGKAWISGDLGNDRYVVYNGGTFTPEKSSSAAVLTVPGEPADPTKEVGTNRYTEADYFENINSAYREIFDKIPLGKVTRIAMTPIASGAQMDPQLIFDEETPTLIAVDKMKKIISGEAGLTSNQDFYLVGYSNSEAQAMCKVCQAENMLPSASFGNGMCGRLSGSKTTKSPFGGARDQLARAVGSLMGSGSWRPYGALALVALLVAS